MSAALIDELNAVRDKRGVLTAEVVLDEARHPKHPLHSRFTWDDGEAAHRWRLAEAGQLLRVAFRPDPNRAVDLRAFVAVRGEESPRSEYVPTDEAMADPFTRQLIVQRMKREAKQFADRYRHMAEYAAVIASMSQEASA